MQARKILNKKSYTARKRYTANKSRKIQHGGVTGGVTGEFHTLLTKVTEILNLTTNPLKTDLKITNISDISSGDYGTVKKACVKDPHSSTCFTIKFAKTSVNNNDANEYESAIQMMHHEIYMMHLLDINIPSSSDANIFNKEDCIEQSVGSILPPKGTPYLLAEFIQGKTIKNIQADKKINESLQPYILYLYSYTLYILLKIRSFLPGFAHGDLNSGNIFILEDRNPVSFTFNIVDDEGNGKDMTFNPVPYHIKIIDFGISECTQHNYGGKNPLFKRSNVDVHSIDSFIVMYNFYSISNDENKEVLTSLSNMYFGEEITKYLTFTDFGNETVIPLYNMLFEFNNEHTLDELFNKALDLIPSSLKSE